MGNKSISGMYCNGIVTGKCFPHFIDYLIFVEQRLDFISVHIFNKSKRKKHISVTIHLGYSLIGLPRLLGDK